MIPVRDRITCTVNDACDTFTISRSQFYKLVKADKIDIVKIGTRTLVKVDSLLRLVEVKSLPTRLPSTTGPTARNNHGRLRTPTAC